MKLSKEQKQMISELNAFMDRNGLTQDAAAYIMATTDRTMRRWVAGHVRPPGAVELLLEVFRKNPSIEKEIVRKYAV